MAQTSQDNRSGWYEASLPQSERKQRGHFSTPPPLIEHILDACGYLPSADLSHIRVLDPACGSGNFLAAAARRLITSLKSLQTANHQKMLSTVQRNLWGFDPDPVACFLAEMHLREAVQQVAGSPFPRRTHLHIHQADGLTLPWEMCEGVDLFLANPPYLATKNTDLTGYRLSHASGQIDSYLLFLELALRIVRPGGWLAIVLPDPVLARTNASRERTSLLKAFTIHHLWHLANVFNAQVGAAVLIAQKCFPATAHEIEWVRGKWSRAGEKLHVVNSHSIPQSLFLQQPRAEFRYLLNSEQGKIIERLRSVWDASSPFKQNFAPLSNFLTIRRGEELGRENSHLIQIPVSPSPIVPTISTPEPTHNIVGTGDAAQLGGASCGRPSPLPSHDGVSPFLDTRSSSLPVLRGGVDIRPYTTPSTQYYFSREAVAKPLHRYLTPKLLVVKSTYRLQAALDTKGHAALQTLYLLHPLAQDASCDDLYFFLALLNSRLLQQYVYLLYTAYKWVQPQIEQHVLAQLPVPVITSDYKDEISQRAQLIASACDKLSPVVEWNEVIQHLYAEQERAIRALYASALPGLFAG